MPAGGGLGCALPMGSFRGRSSGRSSHARWRRFPGSPPAGADVYAVRRATTRLKPRSSPAADVR
jgi:hypothetical protein